MNYKKAALGRLRRIDLVQKQISWLEKAKLNLAYAYHTKLRGLSVSPGSFNLITHWDKVHNQSIKKARENKLSVISKNNMVSYKTSDTLFILGSGPSINEITDKQWEHIASCDSIGFNWFLVHPFIPTYYHVELVEPHVSLFQKCYQAKPTRFKEIPFIVNFLHLPESLRPTIGSLFQNVFVSVPKRFNGATEQELSEILRHYYFYRDFESEGFLLHYRASLSLMITFGILLGYKKIVLAGVDLNNNDYFFFNQEKYPKQWAAEVRKMRTQQIENQTKSTIHRTADPKLFKSLPIVEVIKLLQNTVLKPKGIEFFLVNQNSLLSSQIDIYNRYRL